MENTCVLTFLPVIPKWKIYNSVQNKPVKYCAILKEKREFQHLLENVAFSKNLKNSCFIVDKKIGTSKDKDILEIVFLNLGEKDLLSLSLTVSKKHSLKRRNNLLVFLKNNNNVKYHIQDNNIYVKCDANIQWHIFYNLLEFLVVRFGICNIGAMFYCAVFSYWMLKEELRFLCYKPIDTECNTYPFLSYKSAMDVSDKNGAHTCKKFPKRTLSSQNYHNDTSDLTDSQDLTLKVVSDSKPNMNTLGKGSVSNCIMPKRKIPKLECLCSKLHCKCHESKWQLHKNISQYIVNSYMDILLKKGVTSTDELSIAQGDSSFDSTIAGFSKRNFDSSLPATENFVPSLESLVTKRYDLPLSESQKGKKYSPNLGDQYENSERATIPVLKNTTPRGKLEPKPESLLKAINLLSEDMGEKENFSSLLDEFSEKKKFYSPTTAFNMSKSTSGKIDESSEKKMFNDRTTTSNVSERASAKKDEFSEIKTFNSKTTAFNMFQTASGKQINISDTALKAAEKMFTEVMQSDEDSFSANKSTNNVPTGNKLDPKRVASSSVYEPTELLKTTKDKQLNESIDEMLVENFFEDICFDEKEEDSADATQCSSMNPNKWEKSCSVGKVRKSLGGRRSLKPYSVPK